MVGGRMGGRRLVGGARGGGPGGGPGGEPGTESWGPTRPGGGAVSGGRIPGRLFGMTLLAGPVRGGAMPGGDIPKSKRGRPRDTVPCLSRTAASNAVLFHNHV
jgi:hypothetical protein